MPRPYCPRCDYPERTCLCHDIDRTGYSIKLTILQHPTEAGHAKNTARLINLVAEGTEVGSVSNRKISMGCGMTCCRIRAWWCSFQPHQRALFEANQTSPVHRLVLIDGTWRKAKKSGCPIRGYSKCGSVTSMMHRAGTVSGAVAYPEVWRRLKRLQLPWHSWEKRTRRPC